MSRRDEVLVAAVDVLGAHGLYGLTHRKVDRAAGLAEGTTSNCFRSRSALLRGVVDHLVGLEMGVWDRTGFDRIHSGADLVELTVAFVDWALGPGRGRSVARIALLEAAITDVDVSATLSAARRGVEERAAAGCRSLGLDEVDVAILLDAVDALVFRILSLHASDDGAVVDVRGHVERVVRGLLGG